MGKTTWHYEGHAITNPTFKAMGMTVTNQNYVHKEVKEYIRFRECLLAFSS
jgi:hypothetical protein